MKNRLIVISNLFSVLLFTSLLFLLRTAPVALADEFTVGCAPDSTARANSLINAISSANSNGKSDVINLTPSCIYTLTAVNNGVGDTATGLPLINSPITIQGNNATILRASGASNFRMFMVQSSGALTLSDLTLRNGNTISYGGAIYADSTLKLANVRLLANQAQVLGGAVYANGNTEILGGIVAENQSDRGGGIYAANTLLISGTTFSRNQATVNGGGLYSAEKSTVRFSQFDQNQAETEDGGGIYALKALDLSDSIFTRNTATRYGGGVIIWDEDGAISKSRFESNTAGVYGGGIYVQHALQANGNILIGNLANDKGGGLYLGHIRANANSQIANSIFARNLAVNDFNEIFASPPWSQAGSLRILHTTVTSPTVSNNTAVYVDKGNVYLADNIITDANVGIGFGRNITATVDNNLYFRNQNDTSLPKNFPGIYQENGKLNQNPCFVDSAEDDYRLAKDSPALDSGLDVNITTDVNGNPRPAAGSTIVDRGAYEGGVASVSCPVFLNVYLPLVSK